MKKKECEKFESNTNDKLNEQNKCPICGFKIEIYNCEGDPSGECGYDEFWECPNCGCSGKQAFGFIGHFDVCDKDGKTIGL